MTPYEYDNNNLLETKAKCTRSNNYLLHIDGTYKQKNA